MAIPSSTPLPIGNNIDVEATINGWRWLFPSGVQKVIDWSVSGSLWNHPTLQSTETQADLREVFNNIGYYIQPDFNFLGYFTSTGAKPGYQIAYEAGSEMNISFAYSGRDSTGQTVNDGRFTTNGQTAFCYFPSTDADSTIYRGASGDTWLNWNNSFIQSLTFEPGTNGFALVLHEVLHGLGLKHPHDSGGTGRPTYADLQWVSVMSYDLFENGGDGAYSGSMPIAPMLMDVIALQYLYGADYGFRAGNNVYHWSPVNGQQFVNGITLGSVYALIALGYTMVYGIIQLINFAHGALFMLGAFCAVGMQKILTLSKHVKDPSVTFFDSYTDVPYLKIWFGEAGLRLIDYAVPLSILLAIPLIWLLERILIRLTGLKVEY